MSAWWADLVNDRERFIEVGAQVKSDKTEEVELWNSHSVESRLIDIWATADDLLSCSNSENSSEASLNSYAERMENLISIICADPAQGRGFRETVREAQWEVFNYVFGDNSFGHSGKSSMSWFDQFMFDINYNLV